MCKVQMKTMNELLVIGNNMSGWTATDDGPYCAYPCFADRPMDDKGMEEGGNWVTGNYARWWYSKQLGSTFTPLDLNGKV